MVYTSMEMLHTDPPSRIRPEKASVLLGNKQTNKQTRTVSGPVPLSMVAQDNPGASKIRKKRILTVDRTSESRLPSPTMCYFDQTRWACGYWRWGHFRQQCNKEYRTGETCGLKLVYTTNTDADVCKICKDMEKKQRKFTKLQSDIYRWQREGNRTATIEKAERDMSEVDAAIRTMQHQHSNRQYNMM